MQKSKFNLIVDGQHGSTGKGLINSYLADTYRPEIISCTNMPNAGHTAVLRNGLKFIAKSLPSSAILNVHDDYSPEVYLGPGGAFTIEQLEKELDECKLDKIHIHPRCGVVTEKHRFLEAESKEGTKHIASTMQGCGAMLAEKAMRGPEVKLAKDYPELQKHIDPEMCFGLIHDLKQGFTALHEGSQGFSLDINHGSHYPHCTSRQCTALQSCADMGIPHQLIGDVYLVIRPYPIRVGNVVEDGKIVGYSGDSYPDNDELSWEFVAELAGAPRSVMNGELTTVTKRLRRVFSFSPEQYIKAVAINGATKIALNFANYLDWSCFETNDWNKLPDKVLSFIEMLEELTPVPVTLVGTGPGIDHVCCKNSA